MGYTIGDVLTVLAVIAGTYVSVWAMIIGCALVFPKKAARAEEHLRTAPWISLILGAALFIIGGFFTILLLNLHNPVLTLLGWLLAVAMIVTMVAGGSGLALVMGARMQQLDRRCSAYRGLARSAGLMVLAVLVPIIGWTIAGVAAFASLGAGFQAILFGGAKPARISPPIYAGPAPVAPPVDRPEA